MSAPLLGRDRIARVVEAAGEHLAGDWLLIGDALAALWFSPARVTEDIDLVSLDESSERRWALMDFAIEQGLPVEAVNSAADFFLRRIPGRERDLELLHAGKRARIFRPTPTLFLLLKSARASEADLADCLALLDLAEQEGLARRSRPRARTHRRAPADGERGRGRATNTLARCAGRSDLAEVFLALGQSIDLGPERVEIDDQASQPGTACAPSDAATG